MPIHQTLWYKSSLGKLILSTQKESLDRISTLYPAIHAQHGPNNLERKKEEDLTEKG